MHLDNCIRKTLRTYVYYVYVIYVSLKQLENKQKRFYKIQYHKTQACF